MDEIEQFYEALNHEQEFTPALLKALEDETRIEYIEVFLNIILLKLSKKTVDQEWAISIFKIIAEKAFHQNFFLNQIKFDDGLDGATLLFHFKIDNAIEFIKLKQYVSYSLSELESLLHLQDDVFITYVKTFLDLNVPIKSKNFATYTIETLIRLHEIKLLYEFIETTSLYIQRYLSEENAISLPPEIFEFCRTQNVLELSKHHQILASEDLSAIIKMLKTVADCNVKYLNPVHVEHKNASGENLLFIFVDQHVLPKYIQQLCELPISDGLINESNSLGITPLMLSTTWREGLDILVHHPKLNVKLKNNKGETALVMAIHNLHYIMSMEKLVQCYQSSVLPGIDLTPTNVLNECDSEGNSPLMIACMVRRRDWIELLLRSGADRTFVNPEGKTVYDYDCIPRENTIDKLWHEITLYKQERNHGIYTTIHKTYDSLPEEERLKFTYYVESLEPVAPVLLRTKSGFHSKQGEQNTCYIHSITRCIIQNVLKMYTEAKDFNTIWMSMLKTDVYNKSIDDAFLPEKCGHPIFLKISVFLFIYYYIFEKYDKGDGMIPGDEYVICKDTIAHLSRASSLGDDKEIFFFRPFS